MAVILRDGILVGVPVTKPAALTGAYTITAAEKGSWCYLDPNGVTRVITLPAHATSVKVVDTLQDQFCVGIRNVSTGAFSLTVNDSGATLVISLAAGMTTWLVDDGTIWQVH